MYAIINKAAYIAAAVTGGNIPQAERFAPYTMIYTSSDGGVVVNDRDGSVYNYDPSIYAVIPDHIYDSIIGAVMNRRSDMVNDLITTYNLDGVYTASDRLVIFNRKHPANMATAAISEIRFYNPAMSIAAGFGEGYRFIVPAGKYMIAIFDGDWMITNSQTYKEVYAC